MNKNISASVRQKLKNIASKDKKPFNEVLQYFAMERFLYRLSISPYKEQFILKGALMLLVWDVYDRRVTLDIDMLAKANNQVEHIVNIIKNIILVDVEDDGIRFDLNSVSGKTIKEDADYSGVRIGFIAELDSAKIKMQLDLGFGDVVFPKPESNSLPTYLSMPEPVLLCYSLESCIAEKLEAIIKLGVFNSRMKDFYDIWLLSRQFIFDGEKLSNAISKTFENRGTEIVSKPECFNDEFHIKKQVSWNAFQKKLALNFVPNEFKLVLDSLQNFIMPVFESLMNKKYLLKIWKLNGSWE